METKPNKLNQISKNNNQSGTAKGLNYSLDNAFSNKKRSFVQALKQPLSPEGLRMKGNGLISPTIKPEVEPKKSTIFDDRNLNSNLDRTHGKNNNEKGEDSSKPISLVPMNMNSYNEITKTNTKMSISNINKPSNLQYSIPKTNPSPNIKSLSTNNTESSSTTKYQNRTNSKF